MRGPLLPKMQSRKGEFPSFVCSADQEVFLLIVGLNGLCTGPKWWRGGQKWSEDSCNGSQQKPFGRDGCFCVVFSSILEQLIQFTGPHYTMPWKGMSVSENQKAFNDMSNMEASARQLAYRHSQTHRQRKSKLKDSNNKNDMSVSQNCFGPFSTHFRCFMFIYFAAYRQIVSEVSVIQW